MRKNLTVLIGTLFLLNIFPSNSKADNASDNALNNRPLNVGNYQIIEPGMSPVVIRPPRPEVSTSQNNLVKPGFGLYTSSTTDTKNPITYTAGNPILKTPALYVIWYGTTWSSPDTLSTGLSATNYSGATYGLTNLLANSSRWSGIMQKYYYRAKSSSTLDYVTTLSWGGQLKVDTNSNSYGSILKQSSILKIVKNNLAVSNGVLDPNGIYIVIPSSNIAVSGFNSGNVQFCGYHSYDSNSKLVYGFVGDAAAQPRCLPQTTSPNKNAGFDGMASVLVHEVEEATTDPQLNAWWSSTTSGQENADKCAWTWGYGSSSTSTGTLPKTIDGAYYNYKWTNNYLIQQEFKLTPQTINPSNALDSWTGTCSL